MAVAGSGIARSRRAFELDEVQLLAALADRAQFLCGGSSGAEAAFTPGRAGQPERTSLALERLDALAEPGREEVAEHVAFAGRSERSAVALAAAVQHRGDVALGEAVLLA